MEEVRLEVWAQNAETQETGQHRVQVCVGAREAGWRVACRRPLYQVGSHQVETRWRREG